VNFEVLTARRDRLNLQCPSARTFPGRLHSLGVARIKASCPPQAPSRYQAKINLQLHHNPGTTSQSFRPVPQLSSHDLRLDNGT
jgi:hypothetical protein